MTLAKPAKQKKPRRGPTPRLSEEVLGEALRASGGHVTEAAKLLNCSFSSIYRRIEGSRYLAEVIEETRAEMVDLAECGVRKKILAGEMAAMFFTLKCWGKDRGWVERQEIETSGRGGGPIVLSAAQLSDEELATIAARSRPAIAREANGTEKFTELHTLDEVRLPAQLAPPGNM